MAKHGTRFYNLSIISKNVIWTEYYLNFVLLWQPAHYSVSPWTWRILSLHCAFSLKTFLKTFPPPPQPNLLGNAWIWTSATRNYVISDAAGSIYWLCFGQDTARLFTSYSISLFCSLMGSARRALALPHTHNMCFRTEKHKCTRCTDIHTNVCMHPDWNQSLEHFLLSLSLLVLWVQTVEVLALPHQTTCISCQYTTIWCLYVYYNNISMMKERDTYWTSMFCLCLLSFEFWGKGALLFGLNARCFVFQCRGLSEKWVWEKYVYIYT